MLKIETTKARSDTMPGRKHRNSNLELMRIFLMLLVIAHHYVVNSGVSSNWTAGVYTPNSALLIFYGMWGKICINSFVMITGYFMCKSRLTWVKVFKLIAEVYFWKLILTFVFALSGCMGLKDIVSGLVLPFRGIGGGFTAFLLLCICLFHLLIGCYLRLIKSRF